MRKRTSCVDQTWIWISPPYTSVIAYAFSFPFLSAYDYACALAAVWHNCNNNNDDDYRSTLIFANLSHKRFGPAQFNCLRSHFSILSPLTIIVFRSLILLMRTNVSILPFQMRHQIYIRGCVCSSVRNAFSQTPARRIFRRVFGLLSLLQNSFYISCILQMLA